MVRANESAFGAAKNAYMTYGWLLQEVAKGSGWDKTIAIHSGVGDKFGGMLGGMVRAKCGQQKPDAACVSAVVEEMCKAVGIDCEIEASNGGLKVRYERCPIYEGLAASGINHATIQQLCEAIAGREFGQLNELVPELTGKAKVRERPGDSCVEEYRLAK